MLGESERGGGGNWHCWNWPVHKPTNHWQKFTRWARRVPLNWRTSSMPVLWTFTSPDFPLNSLFLPCYPVPALQGFTEFQVCALCCCWDNSKKYCLIFSVTAVWMAIARFLANLASSRGAVYAARSSNNVPPYLESVKWNPWLHLSIPPTKVAVIWVAVALSISFRVTWKVKLPVS